MRTNYNNCHSINLSWYYTTRRIKILNTSLAVTPASIFIKTRRTPSKTCFLLLWASWRTASFAYMFLYLRVKGQSILFRLISLAVLYIISQVIGILLAQISLFLLGNYIFFSYDPTVYFQRTFLFPHLQILERHFSIASKNNNKL